MNPDWATLPKHLLDLVINKLHSSFDFVRFGAVCLQWHSTLKDNQTDRGEISQHHQIPLLLVPNEDDTWSPYNVMDNKFCGLKLSISQNKRFSASSQGWLVALNENWTVTLYKPYAMVKEGSNANYSIHLPCLFPPHLEEHFDPEYSIDFTRIYDYFIKKSVLTADPLTSPNKCTVIVVYGYNELAMLRIGKDTTWTKINPPEEVDGLVVQDIFYYDNQIYILDKYGALLSCDVTNSCNPTAQVVATSPENPTPYWSLVKRYFVESYEGMLLQVERRMNVRKAADKFRTSKEFRIFCLDLESNKWLKVKSLGGISLFLGENSSISVLASNFIGCEPNSIYFTHDLDADDWGNLYCDGQNPVICDVGIYNVESRNFDFHYTLDPNFLVKMSSRPPIWVVPTLNMY